MSENLTIVKIMGRDGIVSQKDLEKWRNIFAEKRMTNEEAVATGEVEIESIPTSDPNSGENYLTLVKLGNEDYKPTPQDLQIWREIFEDAKGDPDFKIFTHPEVSIEVIKIGDIIAVE